MNSFSKAEVNGGRKGSPFVKILFSHKIYFDDTIGKKVKKKNY